MATELRFITKNKFKADEFKALFAATSYEIVPTAVSIEEIQTEDMEALVADKTIKAFDQVRRPLFVDHTGLYLDLLGGFPGGLTELFWERLKNERLSELIGQSKRPGVKAVTLICYCDGKSLMTFKGEVDGTIAPEPRGPQGFQWDPVFIPKGHSQTFAELGAKKNDISMRRAAIDEFIRHLDTQHG